ncbi:glycosyltransferase family 4 protein [Ruegeria sp. 2205SS24-7]|uniref:glycosyltransferase family 4 protein n=1 Tax=Ruegeria discodermiae TaxID=3064389 RepID=UPI00274166DB|nr:glycosyltransferase family 4 protein [Ruegeria sp. 2205SS24-7]MDP5218834.1 glycosyltransferase family 4 protein [Ruegeria sp. 2205SS24-7]
MVQNSTSAAPARPPLLRQGRGLRVAFIGSKCLLDDASGVGHSIRSILECLAREGAEATSFSASLFDAIDDVSFRDRIGRNGYPIQNCGGRLLRVSRSGVQHFVLQTQSSHIHDLTWRDSARFHRALEGYLAAKKSEIVITYGSGSHAKRMHSAIRAAGAQLVFYLGHAGIDGWDWFLPGDRAICPSQFLVDRYSARLCGPVDVLHPIISSDRFVNDPATAIGGRPAPHRRGFVTHVNPVPHKGLTMLIALARQAMRERPEMKFLVLQGQMSKDALWRDSIGLASLANVTLLPVQRDMAAVYARTNVLLMPSYCHEGFGRAAVEASLSGVPVLASRHGGLPEATGRAGILLDIPSHCMSDPLYFPDEQTTNCWWEALTSIWDDECAYATASKRARKAGQKFHPKLTRSAIIEYFRGIAAAQPSIGLI